MPAISYAVSTGTPLTMPAIAINDNRAAVAIAMPAISFAGGNTGPIIMPGITFNGAPGRVPTTIR